MSKVWTNIIYCASGAKVILIFIFINSMKISNGNVDASGDSFFVNI